MPMPVLPTKSQRLATPPVHTRNTPAVCVPVQWTIPLTLEKTHRTAMLLQLKESQKVRETAEEIEGFTV